MSANRRSPYNSSLHTSPIKEGKYDGDSLRRAMARHQASLSRPESPLHSLNDDLPAPSYSRTPHYRRSGVRTVTATGTTTAARDYRQDRKGFEGTKQSLRNSQSALNELDFTAIRAREDKLNISSGECSPEDASKLSTSSYPYLSHSTYSLPRNHRLYKSNRQFAASLRESQESLQSSSRESLNQESRESLLRRYPSSSLSNTPTISPNRYSGTSGRHDNMKEKSYESVKHSPYRLQTSYSQTSVPRYSTDHSPHLLTEAALTLSTRNTSRSSSTTSSARSSRNNSPIRRMTPSYFDNDVFLCRKSVPVSPAYSLRSSRATSPEMLINSGRLNTCGTSRESSPANSTKSFHSKRSSRAASPTSSIRSEKGVRIRSSKLIDREGECKYQISGFIKSEDHRRSDKQIQSQEIIKRISPSSSLRSSRAASPNTADRSQREIQCLPSLQNTFNMQELKADPAAEVNIVNETLIVVPVFALNALSEKRNEAEKMKNLEEYELHNPNRSEDPPFVIHRSEPLKKVENKQVDEITINQTDESKVFQKSNISPDEINLDDPFQGDTEDTRSVGKQKSCCSEKKDKATTVDLSLGSISNIEELLESLSRRVRNVEENERDIGRVDDFVDNDDSAIAESVASIVSTTSSKERQMEQGPEMLYDIGSHSLIRRQSVIIEGLTLETEELRKRCQALEEEHGTPVVEDLSKKLEQLERKLDESETYCYQVVEENVELKSEIEILETEISEVQDTFREKDAKEFKKVKWELENLSKTCRNLQIKLGKAQAKANRLRQEKEMIEDEQRENALWKTSAVVAMAALAAYQLISRMK